MKRIVPILLLTLCVTSCDFFRSLAGRPTSADIQAKRELIEQQEAEHRARLDESRRREQQLKDSLAALDAIRQSKGTIVSTGALSGAAAASLSNRYYIMIGTFSKRENAEKIAGKAEAAGYPATLMEYRSGFTAVGLCATDNLSEAFASLQKVRQEPFCPVDVWVLANE